jgi:predicted nucleic acid-binding protein
MRTSDLAALPDRVMLDANVLVAVTDPDRPEHAEAVRIVNEWPGKGVNLCTSGQVLREYLSVATRPSARNGLGIVLADAVRNVRAFRGRTTTLVDGGAVVERLLALLDDVTCGGKQVHDANIIATMLAHDVGTVVTMNIDDFTRFGTFINLVTL